MSNREPIRPPHAAAPFRRPGANGAPGADEESDVVARRLLPQRIVDQLREEIVAGDWAPGERMPEQALCNRLGVSRTPLREALKILEAEGLLLLLPNRGAVVTEPTIEDTQEKLRVLGALEGLAIAIACESASDEQIAGIAKIHERMMGCHARRQVKRYYALNDEFHKAIVAAASSRTLSDLHETLFRHVERARRLANFGEKLSDDTRTEHEEIMAALERRDAATAKAEMERHLDDVRRKVLALNPATTGRRR